ncbi:MAG: hypothetical protein Q8L14_23280 [Myxococcales bacterium]|nr:hypothetical protein [Myxococcales bacterium]
MKLAGFVVLLAACRVAGPTPDPAVTSRAVCAAPRPPTRACTVDADCAVVFLNRDCCGTGHATGVSVSDRPRAEVQERECPGVVARCECQAQPTVADDGSTEHSGSVSVRCVERACRTSFLPR